MKMYDIVPMGINQEGDELDISLDTEEPDIRIDNRGRVFLGDLNIADDHDGPMTSVSHVDTRDGTVDQRPAFGEDSSVRLAEEYDAIESKLRAEESAYTSNVNQVQNEHENIDIKSKEASREQGQDLHHPRGHVTENGDIDKSCSVDARKPAQDDVNNTRKRHKKNNYSVKRDYSESQSSSFVEQDGNSNNDKRVGHSYIEQDLYVTTGKRHGHTYSNSRDIGSHERLDRSHRSKMASRNDQHKPSGHRNPAPADDDVPAILNNDIMDARVGRQMFSPAREVRQSFDRNAPIERQLEFYKREYYNYKLSWELDQKRISELLAEAKEVRRLEEQRTSGGFGFDQGERLRLLTEIDKLYAEKESMHSIICHLTGVPVQGGDMKGISMPSIVKGSSGSQKTGSRRPDMAKPQGHVTMLPPITERNLVSSAREQTILSSEDEQSTTSSDVGSFNDDMSKSILQLSRQESLSRREESPTGRSFF